MSKQQRDERKLMREHAIMWRHSMRLGAERLAGCHLRLAVLHREAAR